MKNKLVSLLQQEYDLLDAQVIQGWLGGNALQFARYTALSLIFGYMTRDKATSTDLALLAATKVAYSQINGLFPDDRDHVTLAKLHLDQIIKSLERAYQQTPVHA